MNRLVSSDWTRTVKRGGAVCRACALGCAVMAMAFVCELPARAEEEPKSAAPSAAVPAPVADSTMSEYKLGPGDAIQVFVWRNPELSVTVTVRPDGKISTPLVEDLVAVGKTPAQLARDIETKLAEYVRTPQVSIIVSNAISTFSQVKVIGQVKTQQAVAYREGMTVLDLVLAVGGLTEFAAGNRAKIVRMDAQGKEIEIKVRLEDLIKEGKMSENVAMKPGDVLIVPQARF